MNECDCSSQTVDHKQDCPLYRPPTLETREQYLDRLIASQAITSENLRKRALAYTNGSGRLPR